VAEEKASTEGTPGRPYEEKATYNVAADPLVKYLTADQKRDLITQMQREMMEAAEALQFERAAELRDSIGQLEKQLEMS
jgi:excinuclease ABC subunit B